MTTIACAICRATAWPADPAVRATFDLRCFDPNGAPCAASVEGSRWFCEYHRPPKTRASRASSPSPADALTEVERQIATANGRIEALDLDDNDSGEIAVATWRDFRRDVERDIAALKKILAPLDETKLRRMRKGSPTVPTKKQTSLLDDELAPAPVHREGQP